MLYDTRLSYTFSSASEASAIPVTDLKRAASAGALEVFHVGSRSLISRKSLEDFIYRRELEARRRALALVKEDR